MHQHLLYLSVWAFWVLFIHTTHTVAQDQEIILPPCALHCFSDCSQTTNPSCFCPYTASISDLLQCVAPYCTSGQTRLIVELSGTLCSSNAPSTKTLSSVPSNLSTANQPNASLTTATTSTISDSQILTTIIVAQPTPSSISSPSITQLASSTVLIISTVIVAPSDVAPSDVALPSCAGRLDISMGPRALAALFIGLASLITIVTAI